MAIQVAKASLIIRAMGLEPHVTVTSVSGVTLEAGELHGPGGVNRRITNSAMVEGHNDGNARGQFA
jgi:hypothetical protein